MTIRNNEYQCTSYCKKVHLKKEHRDYKRGDILNGKKFLRCNECEERVLELRRIKRLRRHFRTEILLFGEECSYCGQSMIIPYRNWVHMPDSNIVFNNYFDIGTVCCFCIDKTERSIMHLYTHKNMPKDIIPITTPILTPVVYLLFSWKLNMFKIGESTNLPNRIIDIRRGWLNHTVPYFKKHYIASDWNIISYISMPNSTVGERRRLENEKFSLFSEYRELGEYFKIPMHPNEVINIFNQDNC